MQTDSNMPTHADHFAGHQEGGLISCPSCNHSIAKSAIACQSCGAVNSYVHPQIEAFLSKAHEMTGLPAFRYKSTGVTVEGATEGAGAKFMRWAVGLFLFGMMLAIFTPFGNAAVLLFFVTILLFGCALFSGDASHTFKIDYSSGTPTWTSTSDELWEPLKSHFLGVEPRGASSGR